MLAEARIPIIAFVWRPEEMVLPVTQMAHRTGTRAIFDFSMVKPQALHSVLSEVHPAAHCSDIKISASALMDPSLERLLEETRAQDIWVECHPRFPAAIFPIVYND